MVHIISKSHYSAQTGSYCFQIATYQINWVLIVITSNSNYCRYCNFCYYSDSFYIIELIDIIDLNWIAQDGWNLLVLGLYTSSTTGNRFCTSYRYRVSWGNCQLYPSATRGPFHTTVTCATSFQARPATAGRVPAMGAGCGLSTRGHWDGPVTCNEMGQGICASVVPHGKRIAIIAIIAIKRDNNSQWKQ